MKNKNEVFGSKIGQGGVFFGTTSAPAPTFASTGTSLTAGGYATAGLLANENVGWSTERSNVTWTDHDGLIYRMALDTETTTGSLTIAQLNAENLRLASGSRVAVEVAETHLTVKSANFPLDSFSLVIIVMDETGKKRVAHFPEAYITSSNETSLGTDGAPTTRAIEFQAVYSDEFNYSSVEFLEKAPAVEGRTAFFDDGDDD